MRMSQLFVQTLRKAPAEVGLAGYQFLVRGGFIRLLTSGSYSFLPLGVQTRRKIEAIVHQAMCAIGGQEVALPMVQPVDLLREAGRWNQLHGDAGLSRRDAGQIADQVAHFRDRSQREVALGASHEEAVLSVARSTVQSYRQLPTMLYLVWGVFQNESRTWGGLFGAREMQVMDGYSLHADNSDLEGFTQLVQQAFSGIFTQCGLNTVTVAADLSESDAAKAHKWVWPSEIGEEAIVRCRACGYSADRAIARAGKVSPPPEPMQPMEDVETPDCKTIADLARFLNIPESCTAKALFLVAHVEGEGDRFIFAVVRGDTDLNEAKLKRVLKAKMVGPATEAEIRNVGAEPGYGSPVGLEGVTIVVDDLIPQSPNLVAGANRPGYHTLNVNYGRDYQASIVADITLVNDGDPCPECGAALQVEGGIEMGWLVNQGDDYSRAMTATFLDQEGKAHPMVMGHYRLYTDRLLAAIAEAHHDEHGLLWPVPVAPYDVYLMTIGKHNEAVNSVADHLYADLVAGGVDVLYDDRDERAGVKFNDADLLGMPIRVVVGERGLEKGGVELKRRHQPEIETVPVDSLVSHVKELPI